MAVGEMVWENVNSIHLAQGTAVESCDHGHDPLGSTEDKEFLDKLSSYWLSRTLLHGAGSNYK
jgi:hypothetical protein